MPVSHYNNLIFLWRSTPLLHCRRSYSAMPDFAKYIQASADKPWGEVHRVALNNKEKTYIDPETGYTVFTEITHLERGNCCGNKCRHCPFEHVNVGKAPGERVGERQKEKKEKEEYEW